jgi:predicted TPR repeat methyltransferase
MPPTHDTAALADILARANAALDHGQPEQALALLEPLKDEENGAAFLASLIEALCLMQAFEDAEATAAWAATLHPNEAGIWHAAGLNAFHARNYPLAEERLRAAVRAMPANARAHNDLGMNYEYMYREDAARKAYAEAIRHQPGLVSAYRNLGRLAERSGRLDEARNLYEQGSQNTAAAAEFAKLLAGLGHNYVDLQKTYKANAGTPEHFLATEIGLVAQAHLPAGRKPAVLDLICGPGTIGTMLWRNAGLMIGVDPRVPMLQAAQTQNIYFDLKDQYPTAYLRTCKRGATDLITSNCGFTNVGDLLPVFLDLHVVLSPGGLLVMSYATQTDGLGYYIEGGGAFSHDPRYVLQRADFESLILKERRDYAPDTHPQVDRTYTLMAFAKPG